MTPEQAIERLDNIYRYLSDETREAVDAIRAHFRAPLPPEKRTPGRVLYMVSGEFGKHCPECGDNYLDDSDEWERRAAAVLKECGVQPEDFTVGHARRLADISARHPASSILFELCDIIREIKARKGAA